MAVNNSLMQRQADASSKLVEYEVAGQMVKLSPNIIRNYLVNGNGNVTDQEVAMFLNLCKFQKLNPFLKEAYLIKYGNQDATIVTGKEAIIKRATRNANYAGQQAGVVVLKQDGTLENRIGTIVLQGEQLVGGWAKVFIKGYEQPIETTASFDEYVGRKRDGSVNGQWTTKPATMIRKVALVQALREAFPEDLGGMYSAEESDVNENELDSSPIDIEVTQTAETNTETGEIVEAEAVVVDSNDAVQQALFGE